METHLNTETQTNINTHSNTEMHTHSRHTQIQRCAHNRDIQTQRQTQIQTHTQPRHSDSHSCTQILSAKLRHGHTHTHTHSGTVQKGQGSAVPPGRPRSRLQTLGSSLWTDLHILTSTSPEVRLHLHAPGPGHRGGGRERGTPAATSKNWQLVATFGLPRGRQPRPPLTKPWQRATEAGGDGRPRDPAVLPSRQAGGHPPLVSSTAMAQSSSCSQTKM